MVKMVRRIRRRLRRSRVGFGRRDVERRLIREVAMVKAGPTRTRQGKLREYEVRE